MAAVDHLIAALVELEQESIEIEHRQSFVRSAIEAFGIDADDALLVAMREEDQPPVSKWVRASIEKETTPLTFSRRHIVAAMAAMLREPIAETVQQDGPK